MQKHNTTNRLLLNELTLNDVDFIFELVNTPEWIQFIGDRNIKTKEDTIPYVQKILDNQNVTYWVVKLQDQHTQVGVITLIKRDYLDHHDIGFAFLPQYTKRGYAHEAVSVVLNDLVKEEKFAHLLATTIKENKHSIQLLEKLGFEFKNEITNDNTELLLYCVTADKVEINSLIKTFFSLLTNANQVKPDWSVIHKICIPETIIIKKQHTEETVYNLNSFIEPRRKLLTDGLLIDFEEHEIAEETKVIGNIAQRYSRYQKSGNFNGNYFKEYGHKFFQFIKTNSGWKINSLIWEDDKL